MPRYTITATVSVDVEIELTAASEAEAKALFDKHLCMSASLIDYEGSDYDVCEDSISEVSHVRVRKEAA
jgi:Mn-dependent DtxR family transcriptional regulator